MNDLPEDDGLVRRGQFRIELVQLLNWGGYDGLHRMPVGRGGIAIPGLLTDCAISFSCTPPRSSRGTLSSHASAFWISAM